MYSDLPKTMLYYGTDDGFRLGAHFTFNFQLVKQVDPDSDARHFVDTIISWMDYMPLQYTANWMVGNFNNYPRENCNCLPIHRRETTITIA